jgi:hypothetical protein
VSTCISSWDERLIVPLATGVLMLEARPASTGAELDVPWSGTGTGTINVASDGVATFPRFEYQVHGHSGDWSFSTMARSERCVWIAWSYAGFHAWFDVRVELEHFVLRGSEDVERTMLARIGPENAGSDPSGGFAYGGAASFDVRPGDVYGFRMSGRDFEF